MLRTNYRTGVLIIIAVALALAVLLTGHTRGDLQSRTRTQAAQIEPTTAANGLPEVVVTAQRIQPETL